MYVRGGFTLVEVLAAISLLAIMGIGILSWVHLQRRLAARSQGEAQEAAALSQALRLLRDDMDGGQLLPDQVGSLTAVTFLTVHHAPGDPVGAHRVTWQITDDGSLLRLVRPLIRDEGGGGAWTVYRVAAVHPRVVTMHARGWRFVHEPAQGWLLQQPGPNGGIQSWPLAEAHNTVSGSGR